MDDLVLGLLLVVFVAVSEAIIENVRAKKTRVPVLRLTQSRDDDSGQGWVIDLRSDKRGNKGRAATLATEERGGAVTVAASRLCVAIVARADCAVECLAAGSGVW